MIFYWVVKFENTYIIISPPLNEIFYVDIFYNFIIKPNNSIVVCVGGVIYLFTFYGALRVEQNVIISKPFPSLVRCHEIKNSPVLVDGHYLTWKLVIS